jgi:glycosyltransferase involved in cell wall biosynthesis
MAVMTTLSIVIPAYNEEHGIKEIIERVLDIQCDLFDVGVHELELLIVDDGSKDNTRQIISELAEKDSAVNLICHPKNRGYGAALKTGFSKAHGELIGFLDADGTYPPEFFPQLCKAAMNGSDLVIGSRMAGADSQMPVTRRIGNLFFANILTVLGRQKVTDSASGMRVFKREVLEKLYPLPDGLNLTPVMSTRAIHEGIKMAEIAIPYSERVGRSKLSVVRDGSIFLRSITWTVLAYNPVRILGLIGLSGVIAAVVVAVGLVVARLSGITSIGPWGVAALYLAMVSGVLGTSIYALGATFNYLVTLFYKRPIRQGLFGKPIFKNSTDNLFGWLGIITFFAGVLLGVISFFLGINGWDIDRLWLYLLGGAMFILSGVQLVIYWVLMKVLEELSHRELDIQNDLKGL